MANIKFLKGSIRFNKKSASFTIPIGVAKQLYDKPKGKQDAYFTVIGGVLQASVGIPNISIPQMILKPELFVPQKD